MSTQTIDQIPAGNYAVDPIHSSIGFSVAHMGISVFRNKFNSYDIAIEGGPAPKLSGTVDVASIDISDEQLKGHLLSPDFFDTEKHPQLRFESNSVELTPDGALTVRGDLEIRGQSHAVTGTGRVVELGEDPFGFARIGISLGAKVDRRSFGLEWQAPLPNDRGDALGVEVEIAVELEFVKQGE